MQRLGLSLQDLGRGPAEVFETEADLVAHPRADDLRVGILEHHADLGREGRHLGRRDGAAANRAPPRSALPFSVCGIVPLRSCSSVLLPQPLGPRISTNSPS